MSRAACWLVAGCAALTACASGPPAPGPDAANVSGAERVLICGVDGKSLRSFWNPGCPSSVDLAPGRHTLQARALFGDGAVESDVELLARPGNSYVLHAVLRGYRATFWLENRHKSSTLVTLAARS